jgi:putative heme-binding domain-containing protein
MDFPMRIVFALTMLFVLVLVHPEARGADESPAPLPAPAPGWSIELAAGAPRILFPTAIVAAPDGTVYLGSDPMDMPGPPTAPIDRVLAVKDGKVTAFAEKLWSVMGLEFFDQALYVVHAPYLSAFRDSDGDGRADTRIDLVTGLGPKLPGFNGINDHVVSGVRLGMDGFLYVAVGDKGIPRGVGRDGKTIQLFGGGVIRVRPDGTDLEVVSTGECNPLSVALSATDEIFTYGNDDDSRKWPNSLTHHIVGGHHGYPYQFLTAPERALPIMSGQAGGAGAQGICYNEDGLPPEYRGNLFFCDWGLQTVFRFEIRKAGGTYALKRKTVLVSKGDLADFRPFSLAVAADGASLWLVDWGYSGWLANGPRTGRLFRLNYRGPSPAAPAPRPAGEGVPDRVKLLDHPALAVRLQSQWILARSGPTAVPPLVARLSAREPETGRLHALWALDAIGGDEARKAISSTLSDPAARLRLQAARWAGIRRETPLAKDLASLLVDRDAAVRREAAIAIARLGNAAVAPALYAAVGDGDQFASWSIRQAIRRLDAWDKNTLLSALLDERRCEPALRLTDEAWALPVVEALAEAATRTSQPAVRARIVANLAGLYRLYPEWSGTWFGTNPLAGPFPQKTRDWSPAGMTRVLDALAASLADPDRTVRYQAIAGLSQAGKVAAPRLRSALVREPDPTNQAALAELLGNLEDAAAVPALVTLLADPSRTDEVKAAALASLARFHAPESLRARFAMIYDDKVSPALVAQALPDLARLGFLPPNDLASFLENPSPEVRAAALLSVNVKKSLPADFQTAVMDRLGDRAPSVRQAAMAAVVALRLRAAIPRLMPAALGPASPDRAAARAAVCQLPDPRAFTVYLAAIEDRDPRFRRAAERALIAIRDQVAAELASAAQKTAASGAASLSLDRVLARFVPIRDWRVIGPFPRTAPQLFLGEPSIDLARPYSGALGRTLKWVARRAEPASGCVELSDLKEGAGDRGGFGYDTSGSPDLCAFGYAELQASQDGPGLMLLGSSGSMIVTVNERLVYRYENAAGRQFAADGETVRVNLKKGINRVLVSSRQGIGPWCFAVHAAAVAPRPALPGSALASAAELRRFALGHRGDPRNGAALFFDPRGIGCVRCHRAAGRGSATIGPDLTGLASKYDRAEVISSVLEPSERIATGFQSVVVATRGGKVETGVVRAETDEILELADSDANITRIPKKDIDTRRAGGVSIMPTSPVEALTPREFADLIEFLMSLTTKNEDGSNS